MVIKGVQISDFYKLMDEIQMEEVVVVNAKMVSPMVWYQRLRYMSEYGLQLLSNKELLSGYKLAPLEFCENCIYGK